jgi:hypothetical protein
MHCVFVISIVYHALSIHVFMCSVLIAVFMSCVLLALCVVCCVVYCAPTCMRVVLTDVSVP